MAEQPYRATCGCRPREVEVVCLRHNHSAFNGYRRTRSAYSLVRCRRCGHPWRTRAAYALVAPRAPDACP
jgi:hypothetical protein